MSGRGARTLRIYIEGPKGEPDSYTVTRERYNQSARRHAAVARRIKATIGRGFEGLEPIIDKVDAILGFEFPQQLIRRRGANVRWLHNLGAGVEHLMPLDWLPRGAALTNNAGVSAGKAGETAMMAMLALNTKLPVLIDQQRRRLWKKLPTTVIRGQTVLVVGVGGLGGEAARHAKSFGMRVIGVRRSGRSHPHVDEMHRPRDLHRLLPRADFVVATAPLTPESKHLLGRAELNRMKPGACLVNLGRGDVVDCVALASLLRRGRLGGAYLDVTPKEPLPKGSPLWSTPNLLIVPHCTADDPHAYLSLSFDIVFENARRLLAGRPLINRVRPAFGY